MLRGEVNGLKWKLTWTYPDGKVGPITTCILEINDGLGEQKVFGYARRHPSDRPDPELARRISLDRALRGDWDEIPPFPKEFRSEVWKAYWERRKNGLAK